MNNFRCFYSPSYLDEKKEDRQEQLNDSYDFHCDCEACEGNYQTLDEIKEANSVLTTIELPSWPKLNCSSTVELAIERYNHYCDLLRSTPELNNLDKILVTKYITCCIMKITAYEPKML